MLKFLQFLYFPSLLFSITILSYTLIFPVLQLMASQIKLHIEYLTQT